MEKQTTSIQPTIDGINTLLSSFGFKGFALAKAATGSSYKLIRSDGSDAKATLSEGEKTFVTFLYFYHLLKGSDSESGMTTDRIVVFDDPVSSLDSDILFIVSSLIKGLFDEARTGTGYIKQIFVLTHKQADDGVRRLSGTKLANPISGQIVYCPPEGESLIRDKLANLEQFINGVSELDPLVRMAVMHYQFEAIHPFPDGNGRVGRILNILQLQAEGLMDVPILYLSRYIIENKAAYYRGLSGVTENGDWESWVLYMLRGVETMAHVTRQRIEAVLALMTEAAADAEKVLPKVQVPAILDVVFRHPYCKVRFLEEAGLGSRPTCTKYLRLLVGAGLLREQPVWRENYFINDAFFEALAR